MPPPPREVVVRTKTKVVVAAVVGGFAVILLVAVLVHVREHRFWNALRDQGVAVDAEITTLVPESSGKTNGYRVDYAFTPSAPGFGPVTGNRFVPKGEIGDRRVGDSLTVTYLPHTPSINVPARVTPEYARNQALPSFVGALLLALTLGPLIVFLLLRQRKRIRRMRFGHFASVEITALTPRQRGAIISVLLPTPSGTRRPHALHTLAPELAHLRIGQKIGWILDPDNRSGEPLFLAATAYDWIDNDTGAPGDR